VRRLIGILGIAVTTLVLTSCVNFGPPLTGSVGSGATVDTGEIAAGDVNGEGRPAALVMKSDGRLWWVQRCTFDQCLVATGSVLPPAGVHDLATGDFDENGVADVVAAGDGGVQVFFGHTLQQLPPEGGLSQGDSVVLTGAGRKRVIAADVDHDSHLDVGVISDVAYEYYPGNGAGQFGGAVPVYAVNAPGGITGVLIELTAGDVDGNGSQDGIFGALFLDTNGALGYVMAGFEGTTLTLGYFSPYRLIGPIGVCDIDHDGHADLAQRRDLTNDIVLMRSVPDATYSNTLAGFGPGGALSALTAPSPTSTIRMGDFDANGACDVIAGRQGGISWWHGNGDGTFLTVNGVSRIDRSIPDAKNFELSLDAGDNLPDLWVSQGQPDGRVSWLENKSPT
jgi:hypothetical protein